MIRGCQKRIVVLKNTGSDMFEEAQLVIKDEYKDCNDLDIISEAVKIVSDYSFKPRTPVKKKRVSEILPFALGILLGVLLCVVVYLTIL